jgi:hypothetical protein
MANIRLGGDVIENERAIHLSAFEKFAHLRVFFPASGSCWEGEQKNYCCEEVVHVFLVAQLLLNGNFPIA